jgi:hypothetical protein
MKVVATIVLMALVSGVASARQIIAGTTEDVAYQRINAAKNSDEKLAAVVAFEKEFPRSRILFLIAIDLYRRKADQAKVIEYGEKTLKADEHNVTAMMVLSRNYALEGTNLDRAVALAQQAVDRVSSLKSEAVPRQYTATQWESYLETTEAAAQNMLQFATGMKARHVERR